MIKQYDIYLINLNPSIGHEIRKIRPCIIVSPDEMNNFISTVIIAPLTTKSHSYPTRIPIEVQGKEGWIVLDQIKAIDKQRIIKKIGSLNKSKIQRIKLVIKEMLVD